MKFAVIGGTGLIGSQVVEKLNAAGHLAVPHSPSTGVDVITGQGVEKAVADADVVVNLTNSPTFDDASPAFFQTSMDNLLAASLKGGVGHVVILSIVGADQIPDLVYYRAKVLQEDVLKAGPIPYSIVRATQFMEFMNAVLSWTTEGDTVRLPTTPLQPIAAQDVSDAVAEVAVGAPLNGTLNIAGPDVFPLDELGRITLNVHPDGRTVITDDSAGMFAAVHGDAFTAKGDARIAPTHYTDWLSRTSQPTTGGFSMPNNEPAAGSAESEPRSEAWKTALTVLQSAKPPSIPEGAEAMTVLIEFPPGDPGTPPHRHSGPAFGYMLEGEMRFELEGEPERVIRAGETFWEPGGDVIHYQDGNNRTDSWSRFLVTMMCAPGQPMLTLVDDGELTQRRHLRAPRPGI
jgi:uncharacterized protein YbjT (DUF2867 family)/quercetin dioxygenase-like cupin family protein